jgi:endoglucanase
MVGPLRTVLCALGLVAFLTAVVAPQPGLALAAGFETSDADWQLYRDRFIDDGRVIDSGNDDISHSEGQGYGMLLAVAFDDPETFGSIWSWTRNRIWVRDDLSVAWLWEEGERPPITDGNSAADGDLLIGWALVRAYDAWGLDEHGAAAELIIRGFKNNLVERIGSTPVIAAGGEGFDYEGGLIINPSYWVFPALTELDRFDDDPVWRQLNDTGRRLLRNARFGSRNLTPDWVLIDRATGRLSSLPSDVDFLFRGFGYNAIRMPLYLLWDEPTAIDDIDPIARLWQGQGNGTVAVEIDLGDGRLIHQSEGQGYRAIRALIDCAANGAGWPPGLRTLSEDEDYYSASLFLLTRIAIAERSLECS